MNNLEEQIKQWVISADKYHYLLDSEEEYIAKEIITLCKRYANQQTEELQAKILHYRRLTGDRIEDFDSFFGISTDRQGLIKPDHSVPEN